MVNVLHVGKYYPPDHGGIEQVTRDTVRALTSAGGYTQKVIAFGKNHATSVNMQDGAEIIRLPQKLVIDSQPLSLSYVVKIFREVPKAGLLHIHLPNPFAALAVLLRNTKKLKIVVHWHSDVVRQRFFKWLADKVQRALVKRASVVLATTQNYARYSDVIKDFPEKTAILPCAVENDKYGDLSRFSTHHRSEKGIRQVMFVGRHVEYKGIDILIEAANAWPENIEVVIAGDGPLRPELEKRVRNPRIRFVGAPNDEELALMFHTSDLFILPSRTKNEAFGIVIGEALSFGLPVVCFNIPGSGVSWVNQHGITGEVVDELSPEALSTTVLGLLSDEKRLAEYSKNAIAWYDQQLSMDAYRKHVLEIYRDIQK